MKIFFVAPMPPPVTGQSLACELLLNSLREAGHDVELLDINKRNFKNGGGSLSRILDIPKIIFRIATRKRGHSIVYFNPSESVAGNLKDLLIYAILGRQLSNTFIHMHGGAGMRKILSPDHKWLLRINSWFLRRMGGVVVLGERLVPIYQGIVPAERIHIAKNFAPEDVFISGEVLEDKLDEMESVRVLFLSNLVPGKGHEELVRAISLLKPSTRAKLTFDFAGNCPSESAKREFLDSISEFANATYHGPVYGQKKTQLLHRSHIFVLPTYYPYEGQPISILEAYASGCSVITTDHSGIFDIFTPGRNGQEVVKRSAESIAAALETAVLNRKMLRQYAINNLSDANEFYRPSHHLVQVTRSLGLNRC